MATKLPPGTFFGQTQKRIMVGGLMFAESVYSAESELYMPKHTHENAFFHFLVQGVCDEVYGRTTRTTGPSTLMFHPAGEAHSNRWHGAGGRVFHIDISGPRAEAIRAYTRILDGPAEFRGGMAPWLARRLYEEYLCLDDVSALAMEGLALEIVAEASRHGVRATDRTPPRWLLRACSLLHDRFAEDLSLTDVAAEVDIHPVHLSREFHRQYGCTLGEYVRRLRVEFSCKTLASSDLPLIEIALAAGFSDQSHFTKVFRRQMKMTPGEFRRQFRSR